MNSKQLVLKPRVSEKAYGLSESTRTFVFDVPSSANKHTIRDAVSVQFNVTVENVNMHVVKGKSMRFIRKGGLVDRGSRSTVKRAYVTLKEGDSIPIFAAVEEAKTDGKDKKSDKKAEKAEKPEQKTSAAPEVKQADTKSKRRPTLRFRRSGSK